MTVRERTLNPETHIDPEDYLDLIYEQDTAIHFYLKDDKEWWVAHGPEEQPDGELDGPWMFWFHYPSGGWDLDFLTEEFARFHLDELWYGPIDDRHHSIHRARLVPMGDAPRFVQEQVGWDRREKE